MTVTRYALFPTGLGICAIAWGDRGIVRRAIAEITRLFTGEPVDLTWVPLDDATVPERHRRVYAATRAIPPGSTLTYGAIARRLGDATLARTVGEALGHNPFPILVPCHRVLAAGGRTGGFSARGGTETKMQLLRIEGAVLL
jgi:methylated-DNA-[protein]-cysteine S-methyltransferase